jgi:hypothetical protein
MTLPKIDSRTQKKPLCYDPGRKKFIFYNEITSGKEKIIPVEKLDLSDKKLLIVERQKKGPDYTIQAISGIPYTRDDVVRAILRDEDLGKMTMEADLSMLKDLLNEIQRNL